MQIVDRAVGMMRLQKILVHHLRVVLDHLET